MKKSNTEILASKKQEMKRYCQYCGHTISFYSFEPKRKLCNHCKRYTYKDKQAEFEYKLKKILKK